MDISYIVLIIIKILLNGKKKFLNIYKNMIKKVLKKKKSNLNKKSNKYLNHIDRRQQRG